MPDKFLKFASVLASVLAFFWLFTIPANALSAACHCKGYAGPGGPCYAGPGGPAYDGPGGAA